MRVFFGADFLFHKEKVRGKGFEHFTQGTLSPSVLPPAPFSFTGANGDFALLLS